MASASRGKLRGRVIVLEGLDRAGKSTQCERLVQNLRNKGREVMHLRFPDRSTPIGKMIDTYLKGESAQEDHVIHLLFSANRWEAAAKIESAANAGVDIVIDRYYYSGCVYSAAKNNPSLDLSWARKPDEGLPQPDLCVFLDISAQAASARGGYGQERYEKQEMQNRVRQLFIEVKDRAIEGESFVTIDGGQSLDAVEARILELAEKTLIDVEENNLPLRTVKPWVNDLPSVR